ncbi:hypothetical protein BK816_02480 [Boudabousia tangfeifanii]|uniref:Glycosyltransferase subfamily 4-like N-terminal domain-containing protein n=1 Tax=Boudabousia tangfeifanii TaxID=1912795 RepID=A0A1D9MJ20_9ACTO|nr:glycosyltransferase [Boudabousia tangfeifanii]AOZ72305.1 hypothetical protein BK816_02480 [Boudabousia tangfeifanii]
MPKHILIVSRIFWPEPGAASGRLASLAKGLVLAGESVRVLTTKYQDAARKETKDGYQIRRFPVHRNQDGYVRGYVDYLSFDLPLAWRFWQQSRVDWVISEPPPTTGFVAGLLSKLSRRKFAYYAADLWSVAVEEAKAPKIVQWGVKFLENTALACADEVFCVSEQVKERLPKRFQNKATVVGFGVDTEIFHPPTNLDLIEGEAKPVDPNAAVNFLYAGTASEVHGARVFVDVWPQIKAELPNATLTFVGQGTDYEYFQAKAEADPSIQVHGRVDQTEIVRRLGESQVALASVAPGNYQFAVPTKIYSALAVGTPVVYLGPDNIQGALDQQDFGVRVGHYENQTQTEMQNAVAAAMLAVAQKERGTEVAQAPSWVEQHVSANAVAKRIHSLIASHH